MDVSGTIGAVLNQKSREIYSVSPDATVFEAVQLMDTKNVGALLVMDGERLVGVISERDYTRKIMLRGKRSRETKVAEIMSTNVFTTHRREGVETCLRLMTDQHIRHLPVVDDDKVVGVISIGDLVKHVISCQQAAIAHLENYIHGGFAAGYSVAAGAVACERTSQRQPDTDCRYNFQTVFPPTIVRTARPFSFQPSNGELRDAE